MAFLNKSDLNKIHIYQLVNCYLHTLTGIVAQFFLFNAQFMDISSLKLSTKSGHGFKVFPNTIVLIHWALIQLYIGGGWEDFRSQCYGLAEALREIRRIELTLFILYWFRDPALRCKVQARLYKDEARDALAHAVFMHRLGEISDRKT